MRFSRHPVRGGVVGDFGGLDEEILGLFELGEFGVEPFQQGQHPLFATGDLLGDLRPGVANPFDLALQRCGRVLADVGGFGSRGPGGVSGRHGTPYPTTAGTRLVSGDGGWVLTCRVSCVRTGHIAKAVAYG